MIEDSLIPNIGNFTNGKVQQDQLVRSALRFANKIERKSKKGFHRLNKDCISVIGTGTGSSVVASGKSLAFDGTEFVISGSGGPGIGTYDLINGKAQIEQYNYMPDTLLVHPLQKAHIEKLPHFTSLMHYGEPILQEGLIAVPGKFGDILGLDAYASINCPTGSAYVLSRGRTTNILGQYSPMGMFVEIFESEQSKEDRIKLISEKEEVPDSKLHRRPITTGIKALEERDSVGVYITARYSPVVLRGETICAIAGINVS